MIGSASAPASSANLGPGFDTLGLALKLRCEATAETSESMTITEDGSTSRLSDTDLVAQAVTLAVGRPMHITLSNEIPRARGLGSSAAVAASVAGAALKATGSDEGTARVFEIVTELEGHADNAAAAVFGGLVAVASGGVKRLELHPTLLPVVAIPHESLHTDDARAALATTVTFDVAARSLSRLAFLIEGLADANADVLAHAAGDELHEAPRASLSPVTGELIEAATRAGALHACWSGAGPTALAFTTEENRGRVIGAMGGVLGTSGEVLVLNVDYDGLL
ncbi:MAG: homoserine kinase [Acidimicrobiia bacterium]|nr:MAG: homoserine kinase [Acidimicrobiia bacterium]